MRLIISVLVILLYTTFSNATAQYKVMVSNNYPPYNYLNEDGELVGFNIDILNAIKELYGLNINITSNDWNSINSLLDEQKINGIAGTHYPGSPDNNYIYTRSVINTKHSFLYNSNHIKQFSLETLRTTKHPLVALWENDVLIHYVLSINPAAEFIYVSKYEQLINALEREDVTCAFGQKIAGVFYARKLGKEYIYASDNGILERNMGFKVSKENPEFAEILNNGIEVIISNGEYHRIYDKWITAYEKSKNDWQYYARYILYASIIISILFLILLFANRVLQNRVRKKTKDLQHQLNLNSEIMQELEKQKKKAEESDRLKSAFLASMSHEIRTPLNSIIGFSNLIVSEIKDSGLQQYAEIVSHQNDLLLKLIDDIIDFAKIESSTLEISKRTFRLNGLIEELMFVYESKCPKSVVLKTSIPEENIFIKSDEHRIHQIYANLISNAMKFTSKGSITYGYTVRNNNELLGFVKDTGMGIEKGMENKIFDKFLKLDAFSQGTGLGLSIIKNIIELLEGKIWVESELNSGTTFFFTLPVEMIRKPLDNPKQVELKITDKKNFTVLVAEDDKSNFIYLSELLKSQNISVLHALNGEEAVKIANDFPDLDLILMDIQMPVLNGIEAALIIKKTNTKTPIIAQTAHAMHEEKVKIKMAKFDAYISKPIKRNDLFEMIKKYLN